MSLAETFSVGTRIGTHDQTDRRYYPATIVATHSEFPDCYTLLYDYGEEKTIDLSYVPFKLLDTSIPECFPPAAHKSVSAFIGNDAIDDAPDVPVQSDMRLPFIGDEKAARAHIGMDEIPFLADTSPTPLENDEAGRLPLKMTEKWKWKK